MNITVVYIYAGHIGQQYYDYALRFIGNYNSFEPGIAHNTAIVVNGGRVTNELKCLFSSMRNCSFVEHDNSGHDIGGYQLAARMFPCDLMVFLGSSTYLKGSRWLARIADSYASHGDALYGVMGNRGDRKVNVYPHIRTTGFWIRQSLFVQYPVLVKTHDDRYEFEHGKSSLTEWVKRQNKAVYVVTWNGEYLWSEWDNIPNGFHRGNQSALLMGDHICEPPFYSTP